MQRLPSVSSLQLLDRNEGRDDFKGLIRTFSATVHNHCFSRSALYAFPALQEKKTYGSVYPAAPFYL